MSGAGQRQESEIKEECDVGWERDLKGIARVK